jgi:omega-6 fatty acid desaturase (delta-12 desaturase)
LSWFHLLTALALFVALITLACAGESIWLVRLPAGFLAGWLLVRLFILYHDFQHRTILKGSRLASAIMWVYGLATLNPPSIWDRSHNHHHKNTAKIFGASIGSFPIMTVNAYARASRSQRLAYGASRHPLTIACGYLTVFAYGMCVRSLLTNPRVHWDSGLALALHAGLVATLAVLAPLALLFAVLLPSALAAAVGAYLFYAQHNYPGVVLRDRADWDYVGAALESSSMIRMSPLMHWFTGNIGYHHVHHLNHRIPFYRLPEAMAALPALQKPGTTSLSLADIHSCLALKLWDPRAARMVGFQAASIDLADDRVAMKPS